MYVYGLIFLPTYSMLNGMIFHCHSVWSTVFCIPIFLQKSQMLTVTASLHNF